MTVEAFAPAKINLTLHVTGRRTDGYHLLDSLVVFADIGDRLKLDAGNTLSVNVSGPFSEGVPEDSRNLVWRAAEGAGWSGLIRLEKQLPNGAGIGGGSSDAAAVLAAVSAQGARIPDGLALSLGADVPVCQQAQACRMQGIGEQLTPVLLPELHAVLVNPGVAVPTGPVFSALASRENTPMPDEIPAFADAVECAAWLQEQRNDLESPARELAPAIDQVLSELNATGSVLLARMSGSGATCFALYPTKKAAHKAAYDIGTAHPDWWCFAAKLR